MWKLILITSAIASQVIDSGDDVALRAHLANLVRLDRDRARETGAPRPKLDGDGEIVFSNGARCVLRFDPRSAAAAAEPVAAPTEWLHVINGPVIPFPVAA